MRHQVVTTIEQDGVHQWKWAIFMRGHEVAVFWEDGDVTIEDPDLFFDCHNQYASFFQRIHTNESCPVCMKKEEEGEIGAPWMTKMWCQHLICLECAIKLMDNGHYRCPLCRAQIRSLTYPIEID